MDSMITKTDPDIIQAYFFDKSNLSGGHADAVVFPETGDDVVRVLREANLSGTPVTVSGAGTGTTGGRIPFGGIVMSMEKMAGVDRRQDSPIITTAPGTTLAQLDEYLEPQGLVYPPDPTETSAQIGATIASNASGARTFAFGATRDWVRGLTVVLPTGHLLSCERGQIVANHRGIIHHPALPPIPIPTYPLPETKNAAGYYARPGMDLVDLLIGSEGTLGVIVEAILKVISRPQSRLAFYLFFTQESEALALATALRDKRPAYKHLNQHPATRNQPPLIAPVCLEYFDTRSLDFLKPVFPQIPARAQACIYTEQWLYSENDTGILNRWNTFSDAYASKIEDIWCAQTEKEHRHFKEIRHGLPSTINETIASFGQPKVSLDFAVPENSFPEMYRLYQTVCEESGIRWLMFGHIGDCHLHLNLLPENEKEYARAQMIYQQLALAVIRAKGTISAEHGIGKLKHHYLELLVGKRGIQELQAIKKVFDPQGILNRGNVFS